MAARNSAPYLHLCPRVVPKVKLHALSLTSEEALLWSRVDGQTSLTQLADLTGAPVDHVFSLLVHLEELGAVAWPEAAPVPAPENHPALREPGDLTREERLRILTMEASLLTQTYWELLGVPADARPADIKKAYFQASKVFHPDRFFGKQLGSFAGRLDKIFHGIKQARDVLLDPEAAVTYRAQHVRPPPEAPAPAPTAKTRPPRMGSVGFQVAQAERAAAHAYKHKDLTQARIWAERAVKLDPNRLQARLLAAEVCEAHGDVAAARGHLEHAASLDKANVDVKTRLARLAHGKSDRH